MAEPTLAEKLYLLACDEQGRSTRKAELTYLLRGALLAELAITGAIAERDGKPVCTGSGEPADPLLAETLREIREDRARSWRSLVRKDRIGLAGVVRSRLAEKGIATVDEHRVLGLFPSPRVTPADPAAVARLREMATAALTGSGPVPAQDAVLVCLAVTGELRTVFRWRDRRLYRGRVAELEQYSGPAVHAVRSVLRQVRAARNGAIAASSGGGGG